MPKQCYRPKHHKDKDISYLGDDGALQLSNARKFVTRKLQERMVLRLQRGAQLNLPYNTQD